MVLIDLRRRIKFHRNPSYFFLILFIICWVGYAINFMSLSYSIMSMMITYHEKVYFFIINKKPLLYSSSSSHLYLHKSLDPCWLFIVIMDRSLDRCYIYIYGSIISPYTVLLFINKSMIKSPTIHKKTNIIFFPMLPSFYSGAL